MHFDGVFSYPFIDPRRLDADIASYVGKKIEVVGRANGVEHGDGHTWAQIMAEPQGNPAATQSIVVYFYPKTTDILSGDRYYIYGEVAGVEEATLKASGAKQRVATIVVHHWANSGR